ncbi:uncharacterized protein LOC136029530 [Artemia franciscana]|uniref:uncharacterized protein LOC136029530 n=1 Tax=Artemia franciscana TaxID=6661 RepID=UPI0032DA683D
MTLAQNFQLLRIVRISLQRDFNTSFCRKAPRGIQRKSRVLVKENEEVKESVFSIQASPDKYLQDEKLTNRLTNYNQRHFESKVESNLSSEVVATFGTDNVLKLICPNLHILNDKEIVCAARQIASSQFEERLPPSAFRNDPRFIAFLDVIRKKARFFTDPGEHINILRMMSLCHVPLGSRVGYVVLNCIKEKINEIDIHMIAFLRRLLEKSSDSTNLSRALLQTLRLMVIARIREEGPTIENPHALLESLSFLFHNPKENIDCQNIIMKKLLGKVSRFSPKDTKRLIFYLCKLSTRLLDDSAEPGSGFAYTVDPLLEVLYYETVKVFIGQLYKMEPRDIVSAMWSMVDHLNVAEFLFNEEFCKDVADMAIRRNWEFYELSRLCYCMNRMHYINLDLCEHYFNLLKQNMSYVTSQVKNLSQSLSYLSMCSYRPNQFDDAFSHAMTLGRDVISQASGLDLLYFALDSAVLGCFDPLTVKKIFSQPTFNQIEALDKLTHKKLLLQLQQALRTFVPSLQIEQIPPKLFEDCIEAEKRFHLDGARGGVTVVKDVIEHAFGGARFVIHGAVTKEGNVIDYVVVLQDRDFSPVVINEPSQIKNSIGEQDKTLKPLEEILVGTDCTRYHIVINRHDSFARNVRRLKGLNLLRESIMAKQNGILVSISKPDWMVLPDGLKVSYILDQIKRSKMYGSPYESVSPRLI